MLQSIYTLVITNVQKSLKKGSDWIIDSIIDHAISISKNNPLAESSCIKLPKKLDHPRKGLINIQNINDNEYLKWSIVRYVNPADYHSAGIRNFDKDFAKKLDFEDIKFPVKVRHIYKFEKKNPSALVLLLIKIKKNIQSMYQQKWKKKSC